MQVRHIITNITKAEERERIVMSPEEGKEVPLATRQSSTSGCG